MHRSFFVGCSALFTVFTVAIDAQTAPRPIYRWTTIAGRASLGVEDGPREAARFNRPYGLATDLAGNLYVADSHSHTIRKITADGLVTTLAGRAGHQGSTDGTGAEARFLYPRGIAVDTSGTVYVADTGNHTIRRITPAGVVSTLAGRAGAAGHADGPADAARFNLPSALTVDGAGTVYLINDGLRKIAAGQVSSIALPAHVPHADGSPLTLALGRTVAVDASGQLYLENATGELLKRGTDGTLGVVVARSYASGSIGSVFNDPLGRIFVLRDRGDDGKHGWFDYFGAQVLPDGTLKVEQEQFPDIYGNEAAPISAAVDASGNWFNTRSSDHVVMRRGVVWAGTPFPEQAVDAEGIAARFLRVTDLAVHPAGDLFVQEEVAIGGRNFLQGVNLRRITPQGTVSTLSSVTPASVIYSRGVAVDQAGKLYWSYLDISKGVIERISPDGNRSEIPFAGPDNNHYDFTTDSAGNFWAATSFGSILRRTPADNEWIKLGGSELGAPQDGKGAAARIGIWDDLTTDGEGNCYALDHWTTTTTPAEPLVQIRKVTPAGVVTTVTGNLSKPVIRLGAKTHDQPQSFALTPDGNFVLTYPERIVLREVDGRETVLGGESDTRLVVDGVGEQARFAGLWKVAIDNQRNIFVTDSGTIRKGEYLGLSPGISVQPQSQAVSAGGSVTFSVTASSDKPLTYQWYFNGAPLASATAANLTISNVRAADAGSYAVLVSNARGGITSDAATLTVNAPPPSPGNPPSTGGSGGGGAPSAWFAAAIALLGLSRWLTARHARA